MQIYVSAIVENNGEFLSVHKKHSQNLEFPKWDYEDKKINTYLASESIDSLENVCDFYDRKKNEKNRNYYKNKVVNFRKKVLKARFNERFKRDIDVLNPIAFGVNDEDSQKIVIYYYCILKGKNDISSSGEVWATREEYLKNLKKRFSSREARLIKQNFDQKRCAVEVWNNPDFFNSYFEVPFVKACCEYVDYTLNLWINNRNIESWSSCWEFLARPENEFLKTVLNGKYALIFEYRLPDFDIRPDVILLTKNKVIILEFKNEKQITPEDMAQLKNYKYDIETFHSKTVENHLDVSAFIVSTKRGGTISSEIDKEDRNRILDESTFKEAIDPILENAVPLYDKSEVIEWIESDYLRPMSLVEVTKQLFETGEIPNVKSDRFEAINRTVNQVKRIIDNSKEKKIIFVSGVPGSGKTLVGLRILYEKATAEKDWGPVYISGNKALIKILSDTLSKSNTNKEASVLIKHILDYSLDKKLSKAKPPQNNIIIYDEAQRARGEQTNKLLSLGDKICESPHDVTILCIVGKGQSLYQDESRGLESWIKACANHDNWNIYYPDDYESEFFRFDKSEKLSDLNLNYSIRSNFVNVVPWVEALLEPNLEVAYKEFNVLRNEMRFDIPYQIWLINTLSDIKRIKELINHYFPDDHIGILYSSLCSESKHTGNRLGENFRSYLSPSDACKWYDEYSKNLNVGATEFVVQGIETEWPIVGFMGDFRIEVDREKSEYKWVASPHKKQNRSESELLESVKDIYRVLLTRSRKGMFLYVPESDHEMKMTADFFRKMGIPEWDETQWYKQLGIDG